MSKRIPKRIWLQWYGDQKPAPGEPSEVTWCKDKIHEHDIEYVRVEPKKEGEEMKPKKPDLLSLVRAKQEISIRELAKRLRKTHRATLDECEDNGLNINVGFRVGNGVAHFKRIGEYTVEDLSVPANYSTE